MGNCQAAEVAGVVIQHPNGRTEILSTSPLIASHVMGSNPGHYVAIIVTSNSTAGDNNTKNGRIGKAPVRYLKLLRPDDTLLIGQVYRLVSFEDVLREFGSKKRVRLSRLLAKQKERTEGGGHDGDGDGEGSNSGDSSSSEMMEEQQEQEQVQDVTSTIASGAIKSSTQQWRPSLQTIVEIGG